MVHLNAFQSTEVPQITVVLEKRPLGGCLTVCLLYCDRHMFVLICIIMYHFVVRELDGEKIVCAMLARFIDTSPAKLCEESGRLAGHGDG